jgi:hypothetical protein
MWAIVEIMGHRVRAGLCSDASIGGGTFLRIEHPTLTDETGDEPLTEYYAPTSLFAIRPCSQEAATRAAATCWPGPRPLGALAPVLEERVYDEDDDLDDELAEVDR